jgi:anaerobic selenocysteine-containing dehydrogenase
MTMEKDLSRRNFLKGSIVGAGALTTGFGAGLVVPGVARAAIPTAFPYPFTKPSTTAGLIDVDYVTHRAYNGYLGAYAGGG